MTSQTPRSTLFPYTTLFRSKKAQVEYLAQKLRQPPHTLQNYVQLAWEEASKRAGLRSEEHTSELQSRENLVCRLLLEKKKITYVAVTIIDLQDIAKHVHNIS